MIGDNTTAKHVGEYKTIGFSGKHDQLIISKCDGSFSKISDLPTTNPLKEGVWHCLCVQWLTDKANRSSVWVNGAKAAKFTTKHDPKLANQVILGGRYDLDENGFRGEIAHFSLFNTYLAASEIHIISSLLCNNFGITHV